MGGIGRGGVFGNIEKLNKHQPAQCFFLNTFHWGWMRTIGSRTREFCLFTPQDGGAFVFWVILRGTFMTPAQDKLLMTRRAVGLGSRGIVKRYICR